MCFILFIKPLRMDFHPVVNWFGSHLLPKLNALKVYRYFFVVDSIDSILLVLIFCFFFSMFKEQNRSSSRSHGAIQLFDERGHSKEKVFQKSEHLREAHRTVRDQRVWFKFCRGKIWFCFLLILRNENERLIKN